MPGLFKRKQESKSQYSSRQEPIEYPQWTSLGDLTRTMVEENLRNKGLPSGFEEEGISNINTTYDALRQALENRLTSRGISRGGIAAAGDINLELARGSDIAGFRRQLPTLARDMQLQDIQQAMSLFAMRPKGYAASGQSEGQSTYSPSMFDSIASVAGLVAGLGGFNPLSKFFQKSPSQYGLP